MLTEDNATKAYILSIIFLLAWTSTEIYEAFERSNKWSMVSKFIGEGGRFTAEDGRHMSERICRLERLHGIKCSDD